MLRRTFRILTVAGLHCRRAGIVLAAAAALAIPTALAQGAVSDPNHPGLQQEAVMLSVAGRNGPYRLEAIIVRSAQARGRLPIALITHGKPRLPAEMAQIRAELLVRQARDLAYRGYLAVGVVRRGYGRSSGTPGVAVNAPFAKCSVDDLQRYFEVESEDLAGAIRAIVKRPDADAGRVIAIGGSVGGGAALGLVSRKTEGVVAAINIAGGVRLTNAKGEVICPPETLISAMARLAPGSNAASLWIYSANDSVFSQDTARRAHAAYTAAGGVAELKMVPAIDPDGHHAFELPNGRVHWLLALDAFLRSRGLPTWDASRIDDTMRAASIPTGSRDLVNRFYSLYTPRVLLQAPDRRVTFTADTRSLEQSRTSGLAACEKWAKGACKVIAENFDLTLK